MATAESATSARCGSADRHSPSHSNTDTRMMLLPRGNRSQSAENSGKDYRRYIPDAMPRRLTSSPTPGSTTLSELPSFRDLCEELRSWRERDPDNVWQGNAQAKYEMNHEMENLNHKFQDLNATTLACQNIVPNPGDAAVPHEATALPMHRTTQPRIPSKAEPGFSGYSERCADPQSIDTSEQGQQKDCVPVPTLQHNQTVLQVATIRRTKKADIERLRKYWDSTV